MIVSGWLMAAPASILAQVDPRGVVPDKDGILYVDEKRNGNGASWANALAELADALRAAKTNSDIKQIWVASGTYHPLYSPADGNFGNPAGRDNTFLLVSNVEVYGGFNGTERDLSERDLSAPPSILDGQLTEGKCYHVVGAVDVVNSVLDGFTITNGSATGTGNVLVSNFFFYRYSGGGFYSQNSTLALSNLVVDNNATSHNGGGIYMTFSTIVIRKSRIIRNYTSRRGGGINVSSSFLDLQETLLSGNYLTDNTADSYGAAIYFNSFSSGRTLKLRNTLISGNRGKTIVHRMNQSGITGSTSLTNVTIMGNRVEPPGSVLMLENTATTVHNSLVYYNFGGIALAGTATIAYQYSRISGVTQAGVDGNLSGQTAPLLAGTPPDLDGTPYVWENCYLLPTSQEVNAGNNDLYTDSGGDDKNDDDLAGKKRVAGNPSGPIDIGVYEYHSVTPVPAASGILYVKKFSAGNGSSWANALGEVADALKAAKTNGNIKQIWVAAGNYTPLYSAADGTFGQPSAHASNASFVLTPGIELYGGFAGNETSPAQRDLSNPDNTSFLNGDLLGDETQRAHHVLIAPVIPAASKVTVDGFIVQFGNANSLTPITGITVNGSSIGGQDGGGIFIAGTSTELRNMKFFDNSATRYGGGIYVLGLSDFNFNLSNSEVINCFSGESGGGIHLRGNNINADLTHVRIYRCRSAGLTALAQAKGAGIFIARQNSSNPAKFTLSHMEIAENEFVGGPGSGGGIGIEDASVSIFNSVIRDNFAWQGGGVYNYRNGDVYLQNVELTGNHTFETVSSSPLGGGALCAHLNTLTTLKNVLVTGNRGYWGAAILKKANSEVRLINTTISRNTSTGSDNKVIFQESDPPAYANPGTLKIHNSIVYDNSGSISHPVQGTREYRYSLIAGVTTDDANGNIDGNTNPDFTDADGGNFLPAAGSPVIDRGSNSLYGAPIQQANGTDLAGKPRIFKYATGGIIDLGAYETDYIPDLYPGVTMLNRSYTAASLSKSLTFRLNNAVIGTSGDTPVSIFIVKPNNQFTLTLGQVDLWSLQVHPTYWEVTYSGGFPLPQSLPATLSIPNNNMKGKFNMTVSIPNNTWGDPNNTNNRVVVPMTVN